jgi:hypothetical protein
MNRRQLLVTLTGMSLFSSREPQTVPNETNDLLTVNGRLTELSILVGTVHESVDDSLTSSHLISNEVSDARSAGFTDGASISRLRDRIEYAAANAYHPMAFGAYGDALNNDAIMLSKLWNTIMGTGGYCIIDRKYSIHSNLYVPETVTLVFTPGGRLSIAPDVTLTINGQVNANLHQIFEGWSQIKVDKK